MAETITFRTAKLETGQLIIDIPPDQRGAVMRWIKSKKDRDYDLTIKEHREKRSLDANAYAWVLMGKLAAAMHIKPVEVYRQQIPSVGDNYTPMCPRERCGAVYPVLGKERSRLDYSGSGAVTGSRMPESGSLPRFQHLRHGPNVPAD